MDEFGEETEEEFLRAKKRALYLLGAKDYCTAELLEKLRKNYGEDICRRVVAYVSDYGYLNDESYAKKLAKSYIRGKKHGAHKARFEMLAKGLPKSLVDAALEEYGAEDYRGELEELIRRKYADRLSDRAETQKVIAALARRGYGFSDIKAAIENVKSGAAEEIDFTDCD